MWCLKYIALGPQARENHLASPSVFVFTLSFCVSRTYISPAQLPRRIPPTDQRPCRHPCAYKKILNQTQMVIIPVAYKFEHRLFKCWTIEKSDEMNNSPGNWVVFQKIARALTQTARRILRRRAWCLKLSNHFATRCCAISCICFTQLFVSLNDIFNISDLMASVTILVTWCIPFSSMKFVNPPYVDLQVVSVTAKVGHLKILGNTCLGV